MDSPSSSLTKLAMGWPSRGCRPIFPPAYTVYPVLFALNEPVGHPLMQTPHDIHFFRSIEGKSPSNVIAFSLHNFWHLPHPMQSSWKISGSAIPLNPMSFSRGLVQAFGHPDTATLNLCGSSVPKN